MNVFDNKEAVLLAISVSKSKAEILRKLGLSNRGSSYKTLNKWLSSNNVTLPEWKNKPFPKRRSDDDIFVEHSTYNNNDQLKIRLIRDHNFTYLCSMPDCPNPNPIWRNQVIKLQLDHINGISNDNRFSNLRFLCPNCHTQTETFGYRNRIKNIPIICECGIRVSKGAKQCVSCSNKSRPAPPTKIEWPDLNYIIGELKSTSFVAFSKTLGVSDNSIRKHLMRNGIDPKTLMPYTV